MVVHVGNEVMSIAPKDAGMIPRLGGDAQSVYYTRQSTKQRTGKIEV